MRAVALLFSCLLFVTGCGGGTEFGEMGSVSGKLTMNGTPVSEGTQLLFMQMDKGYAAFGNTDADGNYTLTWMREGKTWNEVPTGTYKVLIQPPQVVDVEELSPEEMLEGKDEDIQPQKPEFPVKYQQHATSGLEYQVTPGANQINIDLES